MELKRRNYLVYCLLLGVWVLVAGWQAAEHRKVVEAAKSDLRRSSRAIANTVGAFIRGLQFRGPVFRRNLDPVLNELIGGTNDVVKATDLFGIALINAAGDILVNAGRPLDLSQTDLIQQGERWGAHGVTMVFPVEGANVTPEGVTNGPPLVLPFTNEPPDFRNRPGRRDPRLDGGTNGVPMTPVLPPIGADQRPPGGPPPEMNSTNFNPGNFRPPPDRDARPRLPFWARVRGLTDEEYQALIKKQELHGLVLAMSTDTFDAVCRQDSWLRLIILFFAGISAIGVGLAWRSVAKTSELQIRLVRASELNTHLKEMNLAAAGLAHETRNPLNIVRGLAQMISRRQDAPGEIRDKSREIIDETDKVTAQLNEFINYSRPRELRRVALPIGPAVNEVVRALNFDIEEKKVNVEARIASFSVEADEQLFRQALFNLVLNAIQAVGAGGEIKISVERRNGEATLEVRDNGPGVPPERRQEIFKPYFTMQAKGTGLGLAVVQQIILAHGWEIECVGNEPKGAVFRITHLRVAG